MGTLKLEIDIPNFEKELNINIIIRKDGEVIYNASSPSTGLVNDKNIDSVISSVDRIENNASITDELSQKTSKTSTKSNSTKKRRISGNMMDLDF